jgi:hypothetical protein
VKQLKSSVGDLRHLFLRTITLRDIAEPIVSFDVTHDASGVAMFMDQRGYDVVGLRRNGLVTGYASRESLGNGKAGDHWLPFESSRVLPDIEPLLTVLTALRQHQHVFITMLGHVGGIVTRGDLQKAPVRLWFFGLVSLLEMQLQRFIEERHPANSWIDRLTPARVESARLLFEERRRRHEEGSLVDCLQLGDKASLFIKDPDALVLSGFNSRQALERTFKEAGALRNALAHANDILAGRWPALVDDVTQIEFLLERLEQLDIQPLPIESSTSI